MEPVVLKVLSESLHPRNSIRVTLTEIRGHLPAIFIMIVIILHLPQNVVIMLDQ